MEKLKKIIIYIAVACLAVLICFLFIKIFTFKTPEKKEITTSRITDELINDLYSFIPVSNDFGADTMYVGTYMTGNNLSFTTISGIIHNYLKAHDESSLESLSIDELRSMNIDGEPLYKISLDKYKETFAKLFAPEVKYISDSFKLNNEISARMENNYFNFYKTESNSTNNFVIYKKKLSYTVADEGNTILIYDYYLKCNKETKMCYNAEKEKLENKNNSITYNDNLDLTNYKDKLKQYVHTFKYNSQKDNYYWVSSENV